MKTLHIIPDFNIKMGGTVHAVINIMRLEKSIGIKSNVISLKAERPEKNLLKSDTLQILQPSFPNRFSRSKNANKWLKSNSQNFDLAIIHTIWSALSIEASHILSRQKVPFLIWPHGSLDPFDLRKKRYIKKLLGPFLIRPILDKSSAVVCTAELEAERLVRYGSKTKTKVLPLPIGSLSGIGDRNRFRKKYSFKKDDFVMLFLSLLYYKKGLNLLIPAIYKISINYPNIKLVIAGSDLYGYEKNVQSWIRDYNLEDRIIMTGFLSDKDKYDAFAGSDCFVLPSMNENFGIAVVEALSAGLPVLISKNVYIWREIIQNGGGWVCNYSIESLIDSISNIIKKESEFIDKKKNAISTAQLFSIENLMGSYKKLYQQICYQHVK